MAEDQAGEATSDSATKKITFNYIKSNYFRVIHAGGVIGGPSPGADGIQMAVFSERVPIPVQVTHEIKDNSVGQETDRVARKDIVREVEVNLIMDLATAEVIAKWIQNAVEQTRNARKKGEAS